MRVFLSYSSKDKQRVDKIADLLQQNGIDFFHDTREILAGDSIIQMISDNITKADVVVVFLSKESIESEWLKSEYSVAITKKKRIIPIVLDKGIEIPFFLKNINYIDFSNRDIEHLQLHHLLTSLSKKVVENYYDKKIKSEKEYIQLQKYFLKNEIIAYQKISNIRNDKLLFFNSTFSLLGISISVLFTYLIFTKAENEKWAIGIVSFFLGYLISMLMSYLHAKKISINHHIKDANKHSSNKGGSNE